MFNVTIERSLYVEDGEPVFCKKTLKVFASYNDYKQIKAETLILDWDKQCFVSKGLSTLKASYDLLFGIPKIPNQPLLDGLRYGKTCAVTKDPNDPWDSFSIVDEEDEPTDLGTRRAYNQCECGVWKTYGKKAGTQMHSQWCQIRKLNEPFSDNRRS